MKPTNDGYRGAKQITLVAGVTLIIKLILFPFAQVTEADAVTRTFQTIEWMKHPTWIASGIWGPFYFYLNSLALLIWNNRIYAPGLLNVFISVVTLIPFYYFTRREFNEKGALIATIFLAICPMLFHNSFMGLSETPYLFLVALTMNDLSKGIKEDKKLYLALAGFFITIAAGFRYEAWLLMAVFGVVLLLLGKWKEAFIYGGIAVLFPVIWMIQNHSETGNALYGISLQEKQWGVNSSFNFEEKLRTIWFFPFSWMIGLGPAAAFVTIMEIIKCYGSKLKQPSLKIWTIPFWTVLIFFIYFCYKGVLLEGHRFSGTLIVLSLPYLALYFHELTLKKIRQVYVFAILTVGLSFVWNTPGVVPLPRLDDQSAVKVNELIQKESNSGSGLIIDFWNWQSTYYLWLYSKLPPQNIIMVGGDKNYDLPSKERIIEILRDHPNGLILLRKNSALIEQVSIKGNQLSFIGIDALLIVEVLYDEDGITLLKYVALPKNRT